MKRLASRPRGKPRGPEIPSPPSRSQDGLTLVEVLVASLVLVLGVLGTLAVFPQAIATAHRSSHTLVLNQLANEKLDALRALDLAHADLTAGVHPAQGFDSNGDRYYPVPGFSDDYSLRWTVQAGPTDGSGTAEPDIMRTVVVEVDLLGPIHRWAEFRSRTTEALSMQYQTYITRRLRCRRCATSQVSHLIEAVVAMALSLCSCCSRLYAAYCAWDRGQDAQCPGHREDREQRPSGHGQDGA